MKKSILNLGKSLNNSEQKLINGGYPMPDPDRCGEGETLCSRDLDGHGHYFSWCCRV